MAPLAGVESMGPDPFYQTLVRNEPGRFQVDRPGRLPTHVMGRAHWHDELEINFTRQGYGEYCIDGRRYPITPGAVFVIPPGVVHRTTPAPLRRHWFLSLYFHPQALAPLGDRAVDHALAITGHVRRLPAQTFIDLWENVFFGLAREGTAQDGLAPLAACTKLLDACLLVRRTEAAATGRPEISAPSLQAQYVRGMMQYVDEHLEEPLSLQHIAQSVGLARNYACGLFRQQSGLPLFAYVLAQRAQRARSLLEHTALPVREVARRCGFHSLPSFYRAIRLVYGDTPARLRRLRMVSPLPD